MAEEERPAIVLATKEQANYMLSVDVKRAVAKKAREAKRNPSDVVEAVLREGLPRVLVITAED